ncbi:MAG: hypothetical protein WAM63_13705, partial [Rhodomicrobium sp.]
MTTIKHAEPRFNSGQRRNIGKEVFYPAFGSVNGRPLAWLAWLACAEPSSSGHGSSLWAERDEAVMAAVPSIADAKN